MRIYNKDGKQIGVQNAEKVNYFFDKKDIVTPPKSFTVGMSGKKPAKKAEKE